jgi:hypothetical protein
MQRTYSYRGFDIVVDVRCDGHGLVHPDDEAAQHAYAVSVTLKADLPGGEWSTDFRVGPMPGSLPADLRDVLASGFAAASKVVDEVVGVMGNVAVHKMT